MQLVIQAATSQGIQLKPEARAGMAAAFPAQAVMGQGTPATKPEPQELGPKPPAAPPNGQGEQPEEQPRRQKSRSPRREGKGDQAAL